MTEQSAQFTVAMSVGFGVYLAARMEGQSMLRAYRGVVRTLQAMGQHHSRSVMVAHFAAKRFR